mmetsp:Transcript_11285/g.25606  ORF Transcript_11285/g.25606 Transcript_11285/m.25606 type:complete len:244 (-) Transcript_11285:1328-2059(-)
MPLSRSRTLSLRTSRISAVASAPRSLSPPATPACMARAVCAYARRRAWRTSTVKRASASAARSTRTRSPAAPPSPTASARKAGTCTSTPAGRSRPREAPATPARSTPGRPTAAPLSTSASASAATTAIKDRLAPPARRVSCRPTRARRWQTACAMLVDTGRTGTAPPAQLTARPEQAARRSKTASVSEATGCGRQDTAGRSRRRTRSAKSFKRRCFSEIRQARHAQRSAGLRTSSAGMKLSRH